MLLKQVIIKNFRNIKDEKYNFNPFLTIIIGENAKGKTNLLEAVYLTSMGEGFRETREEELITFEQNFAGILGIYISGDHNFKYQIDFKKTSNGVSKIFSINSVKRRHFQYLKESTKVTLFSPEQIEIMTGPPEKRRKYLNTLLGAIDWEYKKAQSNYESALRKRNKILERYQNSADLDEELSYWDSYLEQQAKAISFKRQKYIDFLNLHNKMDSIEFKVSYEKNEFNPDRLKAYFELERRLRKTVIGPQKDDFRINQLNNSSKNLHLFGSRSEQRLAVFWLKFNEIKIMEQTFGAKPLLLLDDIFSELDLRNKKLIIDLVKKYQTIVTTTEVKLLELADVPKSIIKL